MLSPSTIALRNPIVPNDADHPDSFKQNMAASIPVPRMSSVHHDSLHFRSYHHRPSYSLTRSSVDRGSSSHSSSHHSHPYSRTSLQSSHRRTPSKEHPPRLTLPPPNTSNSRNFPSSREREYPRPPPPDYVWDSSTTDARRPPSSSGGTERERTPSRRPASGGKSSYALPPLRSISNSNASGASPKIPPIAAMAPPSRDLPPAGRKSPHHRVPPIYTMITNIINNSSNRCTTHMTIITHKLLPYQGIANMKRIGKTCTTIEARPPHSLHVFITHRLINKLMMPHHRLSGLLSNCIL